MVMPPIFPREEINPVENPVDTRGFLSDIVDKQGYYLDPTGTEGGRGGRPSTKQEEAFILDFMQEHGRAPTVNEVGRGFSSTFDTTKSEWLPGSTMGRMGFQNWGEYQRAQQYGETYGPGMGDLIPEGGTVVSGEDDDPFLRFMDPSRVPQGYRDNILSPEARPELYPKYDRSPFERPTMEEALGRYAPVQVYEARLYDYLTNKVQEDAPEIQRYQDYYTKELQGFKDRLALGKLEQDAYNEATIALRKYIDEKMSGLMTEEKAAEMQQEATDLIGKGYAAEELPMYADVSGATGASVQELYNQSLTEAQQQYDQRITNTPEFTGYPDRSEAPDNDNAQAQYLTYVDRLQLAPEYMEWLKGNYYDIYELWKQAKADYPRFIDFVQDYLARGGM